VCSLRVLFIGGSGVISSACSWLAVERGIDLTVLNRGASRDRPLPAQVTVLRGDARDQASVQHAVGDREFDAVVADRDLHLAPATVTMIGCRGHGPRQAA